MSRVGWTSVPAKVACAIAIAIVVTGCPDPDALAVVPGVPECSSGVTADDSDDARSALDGADPGTCVVLGTRGPFVGPFVVPRGVAFVGAGGTGISGNGGAEPVVTLLEGARLIGVAVIGGKGSGIAVEASSARLERVRVYGAGRAAISITCNPAAHGDCEHGAVVLEDLNLDANGSGIVASGARVLVDRAAVVRSGSRGGAGNGVVAFGGARIDAVALDVFGSAAAGVFVDGERSRAFIRSSLIRENAQSGLWVQGVRGAIEDPAVALVDTTVEGNALAVGAFDVRGLALVRGTIAGSVGATTNVDGLLASRTTDVVIDGCGLASRGDRGERVAAVFHDASTGRLELFPAYAGWGALPTVVIQGARGASITAREVNVSTPANPLELPAAPLPVPSEQ